MSTTSDEDLAGLSAPLSSTVLDVVRQAIEGLAALGVDGFYSAPWRASARNVPMVWQPLMEG